MCILTVQLEIESAFNFDEFSNILCNVITVCLTTFSIYQLDKPTLDISVTSLKNECSMTFTVARKGH